MTLVGASELGRTARGRRPVDLLIAATAAAETLPPYTRNPDCFSDLQGVVEVVPVVSLNRFALWRPTRAGVGRFGLEPHTVFQLTGSGSGLGRSHGSTAGRPWLPRMAETSPV